MGGRVRNWRPIKVDDIPISPNRYDSDGYDTNYLSAKKFQEFLLGCPYKAGDVVYVAKNQRVVKARIIHVDRYRKNAVEKWIEIYTVHVATHDGIFSKLWERTTPQAIQRGYQLVSLAASFIN